MSVNSEAEAQHHGLPNANWRWTFVALIALTLVALFFTLRVAFRLLVAVVGVVLAWRELAAEERHRELHDVVRAELDELERERVH